MPAFIGMEKQVEEHPVKAPTAPFTTFAMTMGSAPRSVNGNSSGRSTSSAATCLLVRVEKISLTRLWMIHCASAAQSQRCRYHLNR